MSDGKYNLEVFVGKQILAGRLSKGISLTQFAEAAGCSVDDVQKYEVGRKRTPPDLLWDFAQQLNVPLSYFFYQLGKREAPQWESETKVASVMRIG